MASPREEASTTIHAAGILAGAVGFLSPVRGADTVLIAPIQALLVMRLGQLYDKRPSATALKAAGYAALGGVVGKGSARVLASLLPGFGAFARAGIAAGVTEAIGWAVVENLEAGEGP